MSEEQQPPSSEELIRRAKEGLEGPPPDDSVEPPDVEIPQAPEEPGGVNWEDEPPLWAPETYTRSPERSMPAPDAPPAPMRADSPRGTRRAVLAMALLAIVAGAGVFVLMGSGDESTGVDAEAGPVARVCVVNGIDSDSPFNRQAEEGAREVQERLPVDVVALDAANEVTVQRNINTFVSAGDCDLIVGLGFEVGVPLERFIEAHPNQRFAVIDFDYTARYANAAEVIFRTDEAAFLAGYTAAAISQTGTVGVFGGMQFEAVTRFMDGYALGVAHYNAVHDAGVEVIGWDPNRQTGLFTSEFGSRPAGQALASRLYDRGADTVFPAAGFTSFGAFDEAQARAAADEAVYVIGVDTDWSELLADPRRVIATSVVKDYGPALFLQAGAVTDDTWRSGEVRPGLAAGVVYLAPFGIDSGLIPPSLEGELDTIREGIIDGSIRTTP